MRMPSNLRTICLMANHVKSYASKIGTKFAINYRIVHQICFTKSWDLGDDQQAMTSVLEMGLDTYIRQELHQFG